MGKFIKYKISYLPCILMIVLCTLYGCKKRNNYFNEKEKVNVNIYRFDEELYKLTNNNNLCDSIKMLYDKYDKFMPFFVENIIGIPISDTMYFCKQLNLFLTDTTYGFKETNFKVHKTFRDIKEIKLEIDEGFSKIHSIYPAMQIPDVYFYISGFNSSISFIGKEIGVGTDMYLGSDYPYYNRVVHNYQKIGMRPDCISVDVISAYLFKNISFASKQNRLLENMIYRGKIMFVLSQIFPKRKEYDIMGYTKTQMEWCKKNERNLWNYLMDKKELFQSNSIRINAYLNDGPFTSEISQDCPARIGTWIGLQIIKKYMKETDVSIKELLENWDGRDILYKSKYRP